MTECTFARILGVAHRKSQLKRGVAEKWRGGAERRRQKTPTSAARCHDMSFFCLLTPPPPLRIPRYISFLMHRCDIKMLTELGPGRIWNVSEFFGEFCYDFFFIFERELKGKS